MMIDVHIPDQVLSQLATLIAERLVEYHTDQSISAFFAKDDEPQAKAISYPAPAEPVAEPEPVKVQQPAAPVAKSVPQAPVVPLAPVVPVVPVVPLANTPQLPTQVEREAWNAELTQKAQAMGDNGRAIITVMQKYGVTQVGMLGEDRAAINNLLAELRAL
jgi:hypothetical protein